jgi:hypothetical protein
MASIAIFGKCVITTKIQSNNQTDKEQDNNCGSMSGEQAVFTVGCGDVHDVPPPLASTYGSYICHHVDPNTPGQNGAVRLETVPHDPNNDLPGQVRTHILSGSTKHLLIHRSKYSTPDYDIRPHVDVLRSIHLSVVQLRD